MGESDTINEGDEMLVCVGNRQFKGCGKEFLFSNDEKQRLIRKFEDNFAPPKLCYDCRVLRREQDQGKR